MRSGHRRAGRLRWDVSVGFVGDIWDHAASSILVEEAGGRFSDHQGGRRLETRTAIHSNGATHDAVLAALAPGQDDLAHDA
jgi:histidinol-phosphatase